MPKEYETIIHRWFDEVWNQGKTETIEELLALDSRHHGLAGPGEEVLTGVEAFKQFHSAFRSAFTDLHVQIDDVVVDGNKLAARYTVTGIQTGDLPDMPATGLPTEFTGAGICHVEGGKFVEIWNEVNFQKMYSDLSRER